MILSDLKQYVQERGEVSLEDLARHFDADPSAIEGMLAFWIHKGRISKRIEPMACAACSACAQAASTRYRWNPRLGSVPLVTET